MKDYKDFYVNQGDRRQCTMQDRDPFTPPVYFVAGAVFVMLITSFYLSVTAP